MLKLNIQIAEWFLKRVTELILQWRECFEFACKLGIDFVNHQDKKSTIMNVSSMLAELDVLAPKNQNQLKLSAYKYL